MKKKVFSVILALALVLSSTLMVLADEPTNVDVKINMQVKKSADSNWSTSVTAEKSVTADFRAVLDTSSIKNAISAWYDYAKAIANDDQELVARLNETVVDGEFTVKIDYPSVFSFADVYRADNKDMFGFNDEAKKIFHEVKRTVEDDGSKKILIIKIATNAPGEPDEDGNYAPLLAGDLYENADEYLPNLIFEVDSATVSKVGTHYVNGALTGSTKFASKTVGYQGVSAGNGELRVTVKITDDEQEGSYSRRPSSTGGKLSPVTIDDGVSTGGTPTGAPIPSTFHSNKNVTMKDGSTLEDGQQATGEEIAAAINAPEGYEPVLYRDPEKTQRIEPTDVVTIGRDSIYIDWLSTTFNSEDHVAYVIGYPDGTVKPLNNISREEVATILYRLLRDEKRESIKVEVNNFSDVDADRWSNRPISTMANGAYIFGYEDGTFAPANSITRAEFATMIVRYAQGVYTEQAGLFSDISGHWAEQYILIAAGEGWIAGYGDGTFAPDQYITRAEAMTILNRMLSRKVNAEGLHADVIVWPDNPADAWYYYDVEEATNSHNYTRQSDSLTETWPELIENKDWLNL